MDLPAAITQKGCYGATLQLTVWLDIAASHRGLDVAVRLAGCHVHIILKLRAGTACQTAKTMPTHARTPQDRHSAVSRPITTLPGLLHEVCTIS